MQWAKLHSSAKYNLATSGIASYPLAELPVRVEELEINGPDSYGYKPLLERIARYNHVSVENVAVAAGTSLANHLALAATVDPGDEILIEHPTYELLETTALYLGAKLRRFERRPENGFSLDPAEVERNITAQTKLVVLTNLHNPSGALTDDATLQAIGEIAKAHSARVLVDEVYLEALYENRPRPSVHLGDEFVVTRSLTKAFGLSGVRCGWILASPGLCHRMRRIHDFYGVNPAHPADLISVIAFDHLGQITARAKQILEANRPSLDAFLNARRDLDYFRPEYGTVVFPRLRRSIVEDFAALLREKYETAVVPGSFFDMPQHFRIGIGGDPEMTREGLHRLSLALDEYARLLV
jgi:aspartate/methionine/tyrosine aminotransferase